MGVFSLESKQTKEQRLKIWPEFSTKQCCLSPAEAQACPRRGWGVPRASEGTSPHPALLWGANLWTQPCRTVHCPRDHWNTRDLASLTAHVLSTGLFVLMAWLCPCSLCLKGWGRNRIGGDCLLGQAPKIKGIQATSGITQMQPVVGTFMWSFPLQNICGRLMIFNLRNCNCGNEGSRSLCLGPVICTGCWCCHVGLCCWALPSSSLEEGKEKLDALRLVRLVLHVWHKWWHYIRTGNICLNLELQYRAVLSLFILAPSRLARKSQHAHGSEWLGRGLF